MYDVFLSIPLVDAPFEEELSMKMELAEYDYRSGSFRSKIPYAELLEKYVRKVEFKKETSDPHAWNIVKLLERLYMEESKNEIIHSIIFESDEMIEKKDIKYIGCSLQQNLARLKLYLFIAYVAAQGFKVPGKYEENEKLFAAMADAMKNGKKMKILYSSVTFPSGTLENAMLQSIKSEFNFQRISKQKNCIKFRNEKTNNDLGSMLLSNYNGIQTLIPHTDEPSSEGNSI